MCLRWRQWWWQEGKRRPCFSSIVAHGKVCMGDRTLSELRPCTHLGWWLLSAESLHSTIFGWQRQMLMACHSKMTSSNVFDLISFQAMFQSRTNCDAPSTSGCGPNQISVCSQLLLISITLCVSGFVTCVIWLSHYHSIHKRGKIHSEHALNFPWQLFRWQALQIFQKTCKRERNIVHKTHRSQSNFRKTDLIVSKIRKWEHRHHHPSSYLNK